MRSAPSISGRAEADLTNQYRWYCENGGDRVAERFLAAFDATVKRLAEIPDLGRLRRFRDSELTGLRSMGVSRPFGGHLIFYRAGEVGFPSSASCTVRATYPAAC